MTYSKTLRDLTVRIRHEDIATALGISVSTVRQAALPAASPLSRPVPEDWRAVAEKLAREKAKHFQKLADQLARKR